MAKRRGRSLLRPLLFKVCKNCPKYIDCHLLTLHWLVVYDLLELLHDVGIAVGYGIGQQIIHGHAQPIDQPHQRIQRQAPLSSFANLFSEETRHEDTILWSRDAVYRIGTYEL